MVIFNSHFISFGHLLENPNLSIIAFVKDRLSCNNNTPFRERFSLRQFPVEKVFDDLA